MDKLPSADSGLSDMLTTVKNLVQAVNALAQNYLNVEGVSNSGPITAPTVVKSSGGRVARVSVTTVGSTTGMIYDGASLQATGKPLFVIPEAIGLSVVMMPCSYGVLVVPGTGMVVSVSWS
jgi:hypothetical protein